MSTEKRQGLRHLPAWLRRPPGYVTQAGEMKRRLRKAKLHTVCEEARCPNIAECFSCGTATFMILGSVCTRSCRFCAVTSGKPHSGPLEFAREAEAIAQAVKELELSHVVITSVTRDDLDDGGAEGFSLTIGALRKKVGDVSIEVLVPDFGGSEESLRHVLAAGPDVFNHNLETVSRLYPRVRPAASFERSLRVLKRAKELQPAIMSKTGIMLGLGEEKEEVLSVMAEAKACGVDIFTAGQYLQPTRQHIEVGEFVPQEVFDEYREAALNLGFSEVMIDPLVRSSYHAGAHRKQRAKAARILPLAG